MATYLVRVTDLVYDYGESGLSMTVIATDPTVTNNEESDTLIVSPADDPAVINLAIVEKARAMLSASMLGALVLTATDRFLLLTPMGWLYKMQP